MNTTLGTGNIVTQAAENSVWIVQQAHLLVTQRPKPQTLLQHLVNALHQRATGQRTPWALKVLSDAAQKGLNHLLRATRPLTAEIEFTQHQIQGGANNRKNVDNQQPRQRDADRRTFTEHTQGNHGSKKPVKYDQGDAQNVFDIVHDSEQIGAGWVEDAI